MKEARVKSWLMGAEARRRPRQRVLARVLSPLDLTPSGAYPTNSRRGTPRGFRGAPPTNYRPGRYVLFRSRLLPSLSLSLSCGPLTDAAMITGVSGYLTVRELIVSPRPDTLSSTTEDS